MVETEQRTDATRAVFVSGALPDTLISGDGLLTVLVEEGGITESISRSVPIVVADLDLTLYPEGGDLVTGLPARVYFEGRDRHEANLLVESTALSTLALLEADGQFAAADRGASWLLANRQGTGTWGATQATALALGALTMHAERARRPTSAGDLLVEVNGREVGRLHYAADQSAPLVIDGLAAALRTGDNRVVLRHEGGAPLPYTLDVAWTTLLPASTPGAELALTTTLDRAAANMGETVRLTTRVDNRTHDIVPSPIARIGLPAGLEPQTWQLQELQDRCLIAFYETRPREVTLYWDGLHRGKAHEVALDLVAAIPGTFTAPASSAWPYYDDDEKAWAAGMVVDIAAPDARRASK